MRNIILPSVPGLCPDVLSAEWRAIPDKHAQKTVLSRTNFVAAVCCLCGVCTKTARYARFPLTASRIQMWTVCRFMMALVDSAASSLCLMLQKWRSRWLQKAAFFQELFRKVQGKSNGHGFSKVVSLEFCLFLAHWKLNVRSPRDSKLDGEKWCNFFCSASNRQRVVQGKEWLGSGVQKQIKGRTQPRDAAFHRLPEHVHVTFFLLVYLVSSIINIYAFICFDFYRRWGAFL